MANYDLECLSPQEFESLTRDLFQEKFGIFIESFTEGKDSGIDLRCSNNSNFIIQCKHYKHSQFSQLYSNLKFKEVCKVKKLNPQRYMLVTSVGLTPDNKSKLKNLFEPYCKTDSDIYGKNDVLNLLELYENIAKNHYKLWFTSTVVLENIFRNILENVVNSEYYSKTKIDIENFQKFIPKMVITQTVREIDEVLKRENVCVICGIPGSGKSTIMKFFVMKYVEKGYQPIMITGNINEAYKMYKPEKKQIFYYDDFLGQTFLNHYFLKNEDSQILALIETISKQKNKKFIFSTREYILNQAKTKSEKIAFIDIYKYTIDLKNITSVDKAKILYNHIWHSQINRRNIDEIIEDKKYRKIIEHKNFNPRIIEGMMSPINVNSTDFYNEFMRNLDNTSKIWEHAFEYHISKSSRVLLSILGTFPTDSSTYEMIWGAFLKYHQNYLALEFYNLRELFLSSLKELDDSFISSSKFQHMLEPVFKFHNPSIRDYIHNYLLSDKYILSSICKTAVSFLQVVEIWEILKNRINLEKCGKYIDLLTYLEKIGEFIEKDMSIGPSFSYEYKLCKLLEITVSIHNEEYINYANKRIESLIENMYNNKTDLKELYKLLLIIKGNKSLFSIKPDELLQYSKNMIMSNSPRFLDDFILIIDFVQNIGIKLSEKEMIYLDEKLSKIIDAGIDETDDDEVFMYNPDSDYFELFGSGLGTLEEIKQDFDILSGFFGTNFISAKIEIKQRIENYQINYEPEDDYNKEDEMELKYLESEEVEIDSLFYSLTEKY
ncbi:MAG: hypothetical protein QG646_4072 [Euryarchaeota archaeon]|nr:hypothetical protein [Euryarchaeota archaeon]